jgi:DNA-binding NarL/FixJ family response regulator
LFIEIAGMKNSLPVTIAIVDDHVLVRQAMGVRLSLMGYNVVIEAENGKAFLDKLAVGDKPDICLLDINMPVMDGFETAVHLRKNWPGIKIVFFSIYNSPAFIKKAAQLGSEGFISKDAPFEDLNAALVAALKKQV